MQSLAQNPQPDALQTALSHIDGNRGILTFRGRLAEELAFECRLEDIAAWFWQDLASHDNLQQQFGEARLLAFELICQHPYLLQGHPMDMLRNMVGILATHSKHHLPAACHIAGSLPVFIAAWESKRQGRSPINPDPTLTAAADYLRMLTGEAPTQKQEAALQAYLTTVADHGFNASTYTARVIASTGSDLYSAVVGAIGALKGPLHGGAPGPVLDMLEAIRTTEQAENWIRQKLAAGRRIMGMGHRVYRVRDPRAAIFEKALHLLTEDGQVTRLLAIARATEKAASKVFDEVKPGRAIRANVEFYTAVLLHSLGLERQLFTPTFAIGRSIGWCAHYYEQQTTGRLIRPISQYVGP